jgi:hypothetical protein
VKSLQIVINQRSPVSRPKAYCEECAKRPLSGHVNHIAVSTKAEWDEIVDLFSDDLCEHLEARLQPPVQEQKDKMETLDSSWDLAHEWESAQNYVQRMADKALTHYLAPAGVRPEEEGVRVVVSIESTSQSKPNTANELEALRGELQRAVRQRDTALGDLARLRQGRNL